MQASHVPADVLHTVSSHGLYHILYVHPALAAPSASQLYAKRDMSALQKAGTVLEHAHQSQVHRRALKDVVAFLGTRDILAHKDKVCQGQ